MPPSAVAEPYVEELASGIFAYIQPDGSWFLNNTGVLAGHDTATLIDQCGTERRARALLDCVASTVAQPVGTLVNTHHHGDHSFGNVVMPAETTIVGHHRCRAEAIATGTGITALFQGPDWGDIRVRPPDITFEDRLTLYSGDVEVQLIHFGTPAHTTNDVVAWIPAHRILFAGDLVFNGGTPFALQGSVPGWLETCDALEGLKPEVIVPGHGPVTDRNAIGQVRAYLTFLSQTATAAHAAGLSPLEAAQQADLGEFATLSDGERLVGNLHRAYHELDGAPRGSPLDLPIIAGEMMVYHGGPIRSRA